MKIFIVEHCEPYESSELLKAFRSEEAANKAIAEHNVWYEDNKKDEPKWVPNKSGIEFQKKWKEYKDDHEKWLETAPLPWPYRTSSDVYVTELELVE